MLFINSRIVGKLITTDINVNIVSNALSGHEYIEDIAPKIENATSAIIIILF